MKRTDAFMFGVTTFVAANCISYFVRSGTPYVTGWGMPPEVDRWSEGIGFPFVMCSLSIGGIIPTYSWPWINWLGNVAVTITVSCLFAMRLASGLPPLWPGQSRAFRYSLAEVLSCMTVVCVLLSIAMASRSCGLFVRNVVCLVGPVCIYAWFWYRRQASWWRLTVAAFGLTLIALAVDVRYQESPLALEGHAIVRAIVSFVEPHWWADPANSYMFERFSIGLTVMRVIVPVFGLLSLLVIVFPACTIIRQYYPGLADWAKLAGDFGWDSGDTKNDSGDDSGDTNRY